MRRKQFLLLLAILSAGALFVAKYILGNREGDGAYSKYRPGSSWEDSVAYERQLLTGFRRPIEDEEEEEDGKYDARRAFQTRREILDFVCDSYSDLLTHEFYSVSNGSDLEPARSFLLGKDLTYCIPEFPTAKTVSAVLTQVTDAEAEADTDTMNPCSAKIFSRRKNKELVQEEREKKVWLPQGSKKSSCDDAKEIGKLENRLLMVQHPMEKLVTFFAAATEEDREDGEASAQLERALERKEKTFPNFVHSLVRASIDFLDRAPMLRPYWQSCHPCHRPFRPTMVLKLERAGADLAAAFRSIRGLSEYADAPALKQMARLDEKGASGVSSAAKRLFPQVSRSMVLELFDLYRADHELFGYDATPYVQLGTSK